MTSKGSWLRHRTYVDPCVLHNTVSLTGRQSNWQLMRSVLMIKAADWVDETINVARLVSESFQKHIFLLERLICIHLQVDHEHRIARLVRSGVNAASHQYLTFRHKTGREVFEIALIGTAFLVKFVLMPKHRPNWKFEKVTGVADTVNFTDVRSFFPQIWFIIGSCIDWGRHSNLTLLFRGTYKGFLVNSACCVNTCSSSSTRLSIFVHLNLISKNDPFVVGQASCIRSRGWHSRKILT
jgi:hypothetical protein